MDDNAREARSGQGERSHAVSFSRWIEPQTLVRWEATPLLAHREERRRCGRQPPAAPPRAGACEVGYERVRSLKHSAAAGSTGRFEVTELTQPLGAAPTETLAAGARPGAEA